MTKYYFHYRLRLPWYDGGVEPYVMTRHVGLEAPPDDNYLDRLRNQMASAIRSDFPGPDIHIGSTGEMHTDFLGSAPQVQESSWMYPG